MKQVVCEKIGEFQKKDVERPTIADGEALIKIKKIGVCGTDLHAFKGNQPFFEYPRVLGHELSGVIEEIGENAQGFKVGDPVVIVPYIGCGQCIACRAGRSNCCVNINVIGVHSDGGMREYMPIPVTQLVSAEGISFEDAALVECLSIGAHAVRRADIQEGENVLVIGSGPIGLGAMQFAKVAGANVIAMDVLEEKLKFCKEQLGMPYAVSALDNAEDKIREITNDDMPSVVIDATGNPQSMSNCVNLLSHGGRIVYIGLFKGDLSFSDPEFHKRETTMMSSRNATNEDFAHVIDCLKTGQVNSTCMITHHANLDNMIEEFDGWLKPESQVIKAMITVE